MNWWKDNFSWIKWILGLIWTAFAFGVGLYVSFRETQAEFKALKEINQLTLQALEKFDTRFTKLEDYLLYKEKK